MEGCSKVEALEVEAVSLCAALPWVKQVAPLQGQAIQVYLKNLDSFTLFFRRSQMKVCLVLMHETLAVLLA